MCTKLPKGALEERLRWVQPIANQEISLTDAATVFPGSQRTLERWVAAYRAGGAAALRPRSTRPKSQPNEVPVRVKERVIELRRTTGLCAQKINYKLRKEGSAVSDRLVGKVLKAEGLVRRYRTKKITWRYVKVPLAPGELVEVDIKFVPDLVQNKRYYQFTAIDCASRWRYLAAYDCMGNSEAIRFVEELLRVAPFRIRAIKTDNGSCFTNRYTGYLKSADPYHPKLHAFDVACQQKNILHYLIDPGKPAQNGKVERSHRTDQEHFYEQHVFKTARSLRRALQKWNQEYNDLEHCALGGKTPNEMLQIT